MIFIFPYLLFYINGPILFCSSLLITDHICNRPFGSNDISTTNEYQCDFFQWKHESNNNGKLPSK